MADEKILRYKLKAYSSALGAVPYPHIDKEGDYYKVSDIKERLSRVIEEAKKDLSKYYSLGEYQEIINVIDNIESSLLKKE